MIELVAANSPQAPFYAVVALNALFASGVVCVLRPSVRSVAALVFFAILWPLINGPLEGHILWSFDSQHGVTASDILSVVAVAVATVKYRQLRSQRNRENRR